MTSEKDNMPAECISSRSQSERFFDKDDISCKQPQYNLETNCFVFGDQALSNSARQSSLCEVSKTFE